MALIAGSLGRAGAEKQLVYAARTLAEQGILVRVFALTRGEHYEAELLRRGITVTYVPLGNYPPLRLVVLACALARYRPHVIQSTHFFANLYVALLAPWLGAVGLGSIRSDAVHDVAANGRWGPRLLSAPRGLVANSHAAAHNARRLAPGTSPISVIQNVLDLEEFDGQVGTPPPRRDPSRFVVVGIARHVATKRLDRFLTIVAAARERDPSIYGLLIGDGEERPSLERQAANLGLLPDGITFKGERDDVPRFLCTADVLLLTSDHEGFPNVLLEAMAAGLPVVATPAGDSPIVVDHGRTGYIVDFEDHQAAVGRLLQLAHSQELREELGRAGRMRVEEVYGLNQLRGRLREVYGEAARRQANGRLRRLLTESPMA